jgi:hypothetical protein
MDGVILSHARLFRSQGPRVKSGKVAPRTVDTSNTSHIIRIMPGLLSCCIDTSSLARPSVVDGGGRLQKSPRIPLVGCGSLGLALCAGQAFVA